MEGRRSKQEALAADMDVIQAYGREHPDEFTSAWSEYTMGQRLLVYFTGHLDEHRAALAQLVANPDDFEVRQGVYSFVESRRIADEIYNDERLRPHIGGVGYGTATGSVGVNFRSTAEGRAAANGVREKFGNGVCVEVAGHPYPHGAWPDRSNCDHMPDFGENGEVSLRLELHDATVPRGTIVTGTLFVTNSSSQSRAWPGGSELGAFVLERPSAEEVGTNAVGATTAEAVDFIAEPGQTIKIPVRFGTDDCRADRDYSLPEGTYDVVTGLPDAGTARAVLKVAD